MLTATTDRPTDHGGIPEKEVRVSRENKTIHWQRSTVEVLVLLDEVVSIVF